MVFDQAENLNRIRFDSKDYRIAFKKEVPYMVIIEIDRLTMFIRIGGNVSDLF